MGRRCGWAKGTSKVARKTLQIGFVMTSLTLDGLILLKQAFEDKDKLYLSPVRFVRWKVFTCRKLKSTRNSELWYEVTWPEGETCTCLLAAASFLWHKFFKSRSEKDQSAWKHGRRLLPTTWPTHAHYFATPEGTCQPPTWIPTSRNKRRQRACGNQPDRVTVGWSLSVDGLVTGPSGSTEELSWIQVPVSNPWWPTQRADWCVICDGFRWGVPGQLNFTTIFWYICVINEFVQVPWSK